MSASGHPLRCFLRDLKTRKFLKDGGLWTDELADALGFPEPTEALNAAKHMAPENIEIIFSNSHGQILFGTLPPPEQRR